MTVPLRPQSAERPALQKFRTALNALYLADEVEPSIANDIVALANAAITEAEAYARAAVEDLQGALERERCLVADGVTAIRKAVEERDWLTEGRGPYAWNDDRWHSEFAAASQEILAALEPLKKVAADWHMCPTDAESVKKARAAAAESRKHNWKCVAPENGYYRWQCQNPGCSETAPYPSVLPDSSCAYSAALPVGESHAAAPAAPLSPAE
jgi:hypothetical protein